MRLMTFTSFLAFLALLTLAEGASAQLDVLGAAKRGAESEANRQADKYARQAVRCAVDNLKCIKKAEKKGKEVILTDEDGNEIVDPNEGAGKPPGLSSSDSSGSDFQPGTRVIYEADFLAEPAGEFPPNLEQIQGQMRVVEWNGQGYLRTEDKYSRMAVPLPEILPNEFTLEFDLFEGTEGGDGVSIALVEPPRFDFAWSQYYDHNYLNVGHRQTAGLWAPQAKQLMVSEDARPSQSVVPIKVMVQGEELRMYVGDRRVAQSSTASLGRSDRIYFFLDSLPPASLTYIGNIRIAEIE